MLLATDSCSQPDGNAVKSHDTRHFRIRRNLAEEGNCLVIRACSSFRGRVESTLTELNGIVISQSIIRYSSQQPIL